ncbi:MAG TPA: hypothetical protein VJK02_16640 [Anaerolineales bacterium]|nr:hypothetical protein [Anaerolineales bacterium]
MRQGALTTIRIVRMPFGGCDISSPRPGEPTLPPTGNVVASQAVIVNAPDLGQPGPYTADLPYGVAASGPGRVVVRDVSPAFGGDVHPASVEVDLKP